MSAEDVLTFPPDSAWRRQLQPAAARLHPGKMDLYFQDWLLRRYTRPGDQLLDPMGGVGSLLQATLPPYRCHVTLIELEARWADEARATWARLQRSLVRPSGRAGIYTGDCRLIAPTLAGGADVLLTSPPYADAFGPGPVGAGLVRAAQENAGWGSTSLLGNPHYDAILTSPPYEQAITHQRHQQDYRQEAATAHWHSTGSAEAQRRGYDPPAVGAPVPGTRNPAQIGNLAGARYQAAMAAVYAACVPLVRPGGWVILVIKNVVRGNQEVDLIGAACGQCEALGCRVVATHWRAVRPGPFHHIRAKHRPDALIIDREAALVLQVPA